MGRGLKLFTVFGIRINADYSWFIVFERKRKAGEIDYFKWYCNQCGVAMAGAGAHLGGGLATVGDGGAGTVVGVADEAEPPDPQRRTHPAHGRGRARGRS